MGLVQYTVLIVYSFLLVLHTYLAYIRLFIVHYYTYINIQTIQSFSHFIFLTWYQSQSSDFLVPVDVSGVLLLPSPSSSSHCQKRVTVVTPTVPATLGSHCSTHPTVKAKALSDRTDHPEQNPTKNDQKTLHTRLHVPLEFSASRARTPRAATLTHAPYAPDQTSSTRHTRSHAPHAPASFHELPH